MNLGAIYKEHCQTCPQDTALVLGDKSLTYGELNQEANKLARGLIRLGIKPGQRAALILSNSLEFVISYFAVLKTGAVVVPINPMLKGDELTHILNDSESSIVLTTFVFQKMFRQISPRLSHLKHKIIWNKKWLWKDISSWWLMQTSPSGELQIEREADEVAVIIYTSGTTGKPKGAMLTHKNLLSNVASVREALKAAETKAILTVLPLFHAFSGTVCMLFPLSIGAKIIIMEKFLPREVLQAIAKHKITIFAGVPPMYAVLANISPEGYDLSAWKLAMSGGAALPASVMKAFEARYQVPIHEGDGPTECSPVTCVNPIGGIRKPGSIGLPVPGVEMRIVDEAGNELPVEEKGEIVVKGPNVMKGYLNQPQATAETIKDGWLYTGDIGKKDADGYFYILDRKKDVVIMAGFNIYPREIEEVLYAHPKIAEAAVVGITDTKLRGEIPKAFLVVREGEQLSKEEVIKYCQEKMAAYKVPRRVEFRESLPKTATGKILKRELR